ncbi:tyrosine-type recombinase/integrase [Geobacter benzoatilyticus]|uniref:Site-specific integrase n=1 Tax=Geobacter benzoatilyticus TaxID=2815309 RepID=A0ABX7Q1U7_9BACT|nr:site-specific integrase [Geobacter benzoatilyticus]QSV45015.1 site-specific integrase [Geobacter benzoatilyticus]
MKFTDKGILNLKAKDKMYQLREDKGFGIRILPSGHKIWIFVYTFDGKRRQMNLGSYPAKSLVDARAAHAAAYAMLNDPTNPRDPQSERDQKHEGERQARDEHRKAPTIEKLVSEYIERHAKKFKRSWQEDERLLNREVIPSWGQLKAADITKRDVTLLLESIVDRGSPAMSNQVLKIVRKMFNFAIERDILQNTPCLGVKALAPNNSRERTLTESEIKTLWSSLDSPKVAMSNELRRALKLILVTAQRPGEVAGIHTSEIDGNWWTIPSERAKNGKAHRVYLTDLALELIGEQTVFDMETGETVPKGFIFPSPRVEIDPVTEKPIGKPIDAHALPVAVRRNLAWPMTDKNGKPLYDKDGKPATENKLSISQFTPHDLRRTAATFMAQMGYMDEVIDAVLNHAKQGVIRVYNLHKYDLEKQQALEAWERKLKNIVSGENSSNVVSILPRKKTA